MLKHIYAKWLAHHRKVRKEIREYKVWMDITREKW